MGFTVIIGGLDEQNGGTRRPPSRSGARQSLSRSDVEAEAARRVRESGYDQCRARYLVTGEPIPKALQYLKIQIAWVADTLARLDPIPADYADDKYWPR